MTNIPGWRLRQLARADHFRKKRERHISVRHTTHDMTNGLAVPNVDIDLEFRNALLKGGRLPTIKVIKVKKARL